MERIKSKIENLNKPQSSAKAVTERDLQNYGLTGITLRSYQLDGVNWLIERYCNGHGCILGDEMGLGKTCQTISFLTYLHGSGESKGPFLIVSPLGVLANWQNELARFAPGLEVIPYKGNKETREGPLRDRMKKQKGNICVVLTTYEYLLKDSSFLGKYSWHTLVVDEAHRLKNRMSLLHQCLLGFDIGHSILLSGTPIQNNLKELYALLCLVAPKIFREKHSTEFEEYFADVKDTQDASELHAMLKPFLLRRVKSEVVKDLPSKTEMMLYHGISALQKKYYRAILTKDISVFENSNQPTKTRLMNILMQLRKCVNHPYLFDGVEPEPFALGEHLVEASGKLVVLDQMLAYLRSKGHKVLLFSQMTRMLDILQDYLGYRGYTYERLDGSVRGEERYLAIQNFNEDDETFIFLLSTKAGGVGLNLVSADTVIFVDSDFNPQNDLQAAARAHRIGQTRPVKVIRLIGRSTVEEIILKRAEAKLKLTEAVIEGGQFSSESANSNKEDLIADKDVKIQDILKFGFDRLFANDDSTVEDVDFDAVLGKSENGEWKTDEEIINAQATMAEASMDLDATEEAEVGQSMYMFEGTDYSKEPSTADVQAFEDLIQAQKDIIEEEMANSSEARPLRRTKTKLFPGQLLPNVSMNTRKPLTEEEKEQRRIKREEAAERRAKAAEEAQIKKAEAKKKKRDALWRENGYHSCNISLDSEGEETGNEQEEFTPSGGGDGFNSDDEQSTSNHRQIHYVVGDVTKPQNTNNEEAIIVHCVDDSGVWGSGGIFSALSAKSDEPDTHYTLAGQMKDLSLGDAHLIPLASEEEATSIGGQYVCLIVAQHRDKRAGLSGIKLSALSQGLQKLCKAATQMKASVHLPRIGHNTPGFNWYGTERLIRKYLTLKAVPTYIYYYPRRHKLKRKQFKQTSQTSSEDDTPDYSVNKASTSQDHSPPPVKRQRSTSSQQSDSSMPSLPTFMSGVQAYFVDLPKEQVKKLTRYLIAYDGDVNKSIKEETTHVIVADSISSTKELKSIQEDLAKHDHIKVVKVEWLEQCVEKKKNFDLDDWTIE